MRLLLATISLLYCIFRAFTAPDVNSGTINTFSDVLLVLAFHAPPVINWCVLAVISGGLCIAIINDDLGSV